MNYSRCFPLNLTAEEDHMGNFDAVRLVHHPSRSKTRCITPAPSHGAYALEGKQVTGECPLLSNI